MKSPITKNEMLLKKEIQTMTYRKEEFEIVFNFYECPDTGERYESEVLSELNYNQVLNQYRERHNLPFPSQIKELRKKYDLSATKMSEILGFGVHMYKNYENGEIPSSSNAKLIQIAQDASKFQELVTLCDNLKDKEREKILKNIDKVIKEEANIYNFNKATFLLGNDAPNEYNGYQKPYLEKFLQMIGYFSNLKPFKTKLNKLMFYADFLNYKKYGYSISGAYYKALQYGPVPENFQSLYETAEKDGYVKVDYKDYPDGIIGEQYVPNNNFNFNDQIFTPQEINTLEFVASNFKNTSTKDMIDFSHEEAAWIKNVNEKNIISYKDSFDLIYV